MEGQRVRFHRRHLPRRLCRQGNPSCALQAQIDRWQLALVGVHRRRHVGQYLRATVRCAQLQRPSHQDCLHHARIPQRCRRRGAEAVGQGPQPPQGEDSHLRGKDDAEEGSDARVPGTGGAQCRGWSWQQDEELEHRQAQGNRHGTHGHLREEGRVHLREPQAGVRFARPVRWPHRVLPLDRVCGSRGATELPSSTRCRVQERKVRHQLRKRGYAQQHV
mmetsp:Transcript_23914/g.67510  ORF Transcript_23914/g.67510 Transcript_23914/m.67510 type:complete len:219 (-) Transcript_23914:118-774(-)